MAITFISKSQVIGSAQHATPSEPAGAQAGDFLLAIAIVDTGSGGTGTISLPTGWTAIRATTGFPPTSSVFRYLSGWIIRGSSAPDLTFTMPRSDYREVHVMAYSGVDPDQPLAAVASAVAGQTASPNKADPPSVDVPIDDALAVTYGWHWGGAPSPGGWTAPTNYTRRTGETAGCASMAADRQLSSSGTEDPGVFGGTPQVSEPSVMDTIALRPAGGSEPEEAEGASEADGAGDALEDAHRISIATYAPGSG